MLLCDLGVSQGVVASPRSNTSAEVQAMKTITRFRRGSERSGACKTRSIPSREILRSELEFEELRAGGPPGPSDRRRLRAKGQSPGAIPPIQETLPQDCRGWRDVCTLGRIFRQSWGIPTSVLCPHSRQFIVAGYSFLSAEGGYQRTRATAE